MRFPLALTVVFALALGVQLQAQVTFAGTSGVGVESSYLPTAAHPAGLSPAAAFAGLPNASTMVGPPAGSFAGGMACDQRNAWIYTTNGVEITMDQDPNFLAFGLTPPPPFTGPMPLPLPSAAPFVTGLGFDNNNGVLWASSQNLFWGLDPLPPFNMIVPPQPIPTAGVPISGLGYDPCDDTLWACDVQGGIYHFDLSGAPIGLQPVNIVPTFNVLGGLTVATHNGVGAVPAPACSTQIAGYHVTVNDGLAIHDALGGPPALPLSGAGTPYGLAYSSDFQVLRCAPGGVPGSVCSSGLAPFAGTRFPLISAGFNALHVTNAPPSTPAILLIDACPQLPCWFGLMMDPFSWISLPSATDGFGNASVGFFAGGFPKGFQFSFQWAIQDPLSPLGYCFSNVSTQTVGTP